MAFGKFNFWIFPTKEKVESHARERVIAKYDAYDALLNQDKGDAKFLSMQDSGPGSDHDYEDSDDKPSINLSTVPDSTSDAITDNIPMKGLNYLRSGFEKIQSSFTSNVETVKSIAAESENFENNQIADEILQQCEKKLSSYLKREEKRKQLGLQESDQMQAMTMSLSENFQSPPDSQSDSLQRYETEVLNCAKKISGSYGIKTLHRWEIIRLVQEKAEYKSKLMRISQTQQSQRQHRESEAESELYAEDYHSESETKTSGLVSEPSTINNDSSTSNYKSTFRWKSKTQVEDESDQEVRMPISYRVNGKNEEYD